MATEVATEVCYMEKHSCNHMTFPWSPKKAPRAEQPPGSHRGVIMEETSILNLTTDDEESEGALQQSFHTLDELHETSFITTTTEKDMFPTLEDRDGVYAVVTCTPPPPPHHHHHHGDDAQQQRTCCPSDATTDAVDHPHNNNNNDSSILTRLLDTSSNSIRNISESLADGLCISSSHNNESQDAALVNQSCGDVMSRICDSTTQATLSVTRQVELDLYNVLGCVEAPSDELVQVWPQSTVVPARAVDSSGFPHRRASIQTRAQRIRRLREESFHSQQRPHNGPPPACCQETLLQRTKSMDDSLFKSTSCTMNTTAKTAANTDSLGDWLLGGGNLFDSQEHELQHLIGDVDPIERVPEEEDILSYDSDPGDSYYLRDSFFRECSLSDDCEEPLVLEQQEGEYPDDEYLPEEQHYQDYYQQHIPYDGHRARVAAKVTEQQEMESVDPSLQDTMNCTWTLTWHPKASPEDESSRSCCPTKPSGVDVWMERGTMLNNFATIVEPKLMWRQVYQPELHASRKLSMSFQKPFQLRLLAICRIVECSSSSTSVKVNRELYPFAQASKSFLIKTCTGEEYLFEASSEQEKRAIIKVWKLVVARLASLAVVEDMENMALEFFTPMVQNQMLVTY